MRKRIRKIVITLLLSCMCLLISKPVSVYAEKSELESRQEITQKAVVLTVGSDESSRNLTWYADTDSDGEVQYAPKETMQNGEFPANYETATAEIKETNDKGFYSNQATMMNLRENTEYVYRLKNEETVSEVYSFKTGKFDGEFTFVFVGDPQIGGENQKEDETGWSRTLEVIVSQLQPEFMLTAGDHVDEAADESQYAGYIHSAFTSLPSATSIGNHDNDSEAYSEHFNLPNESPEYGKTDAGSDYWFVYGNALFMNINSNNKSNAEHKAFMEEAINENPDVTWKTVVFHHSIFSTALHADSDSNKERREELSEIFKELDIDVVLMGHDHVYVRTYMMDGQEPDTEQGVQTEVTNPDGILYLTANSSSGSKYYDITEPDAEYAAVTIQPKHRTVIAVEVTDTSYEITTCFAHGLNELDHFTIYKMSESEENISEETAPEGTEGTSMPDTGTEVDTETDTEENTKDNTEDKTEDKTEQQAETDPAESKDAGKVYASVILLLVLGLGFGSGAVLVKWIYSKKYH